MGHKINPTGFRIGINKGHTSSWFADKKSYANNVLSDHIAREYLLKKLAPSGVADIFIKRTLNSISIDITVARPGVVIGRGGKAIEDLKKYLSRIFKNKVEIKIIEAKNPEAQSAIVAYMVADQCMRRVPPKQAMQRELLKIKDMPGVYGAKIWVKGRIKGQEIARTEKVQWGSIPLHTLRADIDYAFYPVRVPNAGLHSVKVWIYKGEKVQVEEERL